MFTSGTPRKRSWIISSLAPKPPVAKNTALVAMDSTVLLSRMAFTPATTPSSSTTSVASQL